MLSPSDLEQRLLASFPDAQVQITDLTGTQDHYQLRIVSQRFAGLAPLARHRMVYAALGEAMRGPIHALSFEALAPTEA
ncbi:MAG: BolA family transcriptional regulator [Polyangiaceae bacterium]|nr:BolA family transcriptional regulator [Myxococcales bacterium]MCB9586828.1 BolA family transcriptional regulator [Polyangiaceae bacterium]MCB9606335.1 BolA family transcriptional regulator [Polyangiaceae bacterium]